MRLFAILVRCIVVGAICIVASAVYVANGYAQYVPSSDKAMKSVSATCPDTHVDGLWAYTASHGVLCYSAALDTRVQSVSDGVVVTAFLQCAQDEEFFIAFRTGGRLYGQCKQPNGSVVPGYVATVSLSVDRAGYNTKQQTTTGLMLANVFVFLAGISFGWRMSIRPPVGLME